LIRLAAGGLIGAGRRVTETAEINVIVDGDLVSFASHLDV